MRAIRDGPWWYSGLHTTLHMYVVYSIDIFITKGDKLSCSCIIEIVLTIRGPFSFAIAK